MSRSFLRSSFVPLGLGLAAVGVAVGALYLNDRTLAVPPPYAGSAYYTKGFIREAQEQPGGWVALQGTQVMLPKNFHGRWFNTVNGARLTLGQPPKPDHTLWLLGGSAVYNAEVPDAFTVASQLQNLLNKKNLNWAVQNAGTPGATSADETQHLKLLPLKPGDIVVLLDGAEDAQQHMPAEAMVSNMGNALDDAARYSRIHGIRFVQMLQPMLFAQPALSDYEKTIPPQPALVEGYKQLRAALPQLAAHSQWEYADLAELLNGPDEYYVTCCTSNERAGALIAGYMADFLFKTQQPKP
jgi:hypothetical protein